MLRICPPGSAQDGFEVDCCPLTPAAHSRFSSQEDLVYGRNVAEV
jgi:hypothetical protein